MDKMLHKVGKMDPLIFCPTYGMQENEVTEHISVPYNNQSIFIFMPRFEKYISF